MKFAITPKGIGKRPGARAIEDNGALSAEGTFSVPEGGYNPSLVLADDGLSLRPKTQAELDGETAAEAAVGVEHDAQTALLADAKSDAIFTALQTATPAQIATFTANRFPAFTAPQQAVIRLLLQVAALTLRRGR